MGFQPAGGVKEFIKLDDTPAAYAGEAGKAAVVNAGETALEFGAIPSAPIQPSWDSTIIYDAGCPLAWTDLDIGVGKCMAYLCVERAVIAAELRIQWRKDGEAVNDTAESALNHVGIATNKTGCYILVITDDAGLIEWKANVAHAVTITRLAYWKLPSMPDTTLYSGNTPATGWYNLNCGVPNALVILRVKSSEGDISAIKMPLAKKDETNTVVNAEMKGAAFGNNIWDDHQAYIVQLTDDEGYIKWYSFYADRNIEIELACVVPGYQKIYLEIFNGAGSAAWAALTEVALGGKCFAWLYVEETTGGAASYPKYFRENGSALDMASPVFCVASCSLQPVNTFSYVLVPFDVTSTVEWSEGTDHNCIIKAVGLLR